MYCISVVLSKEKIKAAVYDKEYKKIAMSENTALPTAACAAKLCKELLAENGVSADKVVHVGVALPEDMGCPHLFAEEMERLIGVKTIAESYVGAKALGEAYLAGDTDSLILLTLGDTVESAVVLDRKLFSGFNRLGGKFAHTVIHFGGYECSCGRKGCLESYVSTAGIKRIATDAGIENAESITLAELFRKTDAASAVAKRAYIEKLASAVTSIINLFQTRELVLDGELTMLGDALMKPMMEIVLREQYSRDLPNKCNVRFANKAEETVLIGAALLSK